MQAINGRTTPFMKLKTLYRRCRDDLRVIRLTFRAWKGQPWWKIPWAAFRNARVCRQDRFEPSEAFFRGILGPQGAAYRQGVLSRKAMTRFQKQLNPPAMEGLFKNKLTFYRHCEAHGLPVPKVLAVYDPGRKQLMAADGEPLAAVSEVEAFLSESLPETFLKKPGRGRFWRGMNAQVRAPDGEFFTAKGESLTAGDLLALLGSLGPDGAIIQARLRNHPFLNDLTGCEGLQACRITTVVDVDDQPRILYGYQKIIGEPTTVVDNSELRSLHGELIGGAAGNIQATVEINTGRLSRGKDWALAGTGVQYIDHHPITGRRIEGLCVPNWPSMCDLACRAAMTVLPARTIGWDIANTPDGPCIVEGNIWWGPGTVHLTKPVIVRELSATIDAFAGRAGGVPA